MLESLTIPRQNKAISKVIIYLSNISKLVFLQHVFVKIEPVLLNLRTMHLTFKILCTLFITGTIQFADCFPQFSIPFVSWNKNKQESTKFTFNIQNPFSSSFGKNRQYEKNRGNNEVVHTGERIVPVTPNPGANYDKFRTQVQTTQDPRVWIVKKHNDEKDLQNNKPNVENRNNFEDNEDKKVEFNFNDDDINRIFQNYDLTTESTTEYESTTADDSDLYRSGVSGHVVATLLG